jgi:translation initiation factor 4G
LITAIPSDRNEIEMVKHLYGDGAQSFVVQPGASSTAGGNNGPATDEIGSEEGRKRKEKEEKERKATEAEKLGLAEETEERRVAAKLAEKQKPEEGEIVGNPTSKEPPKEVKEVPPGKEGRKTKKTRCRPDLIGMASLNVSATPPFALVAAKIIEDLSHISYPEGVIGPKPELNVNSKKGGFM